MSRSMNMSHVKWLPKTAATFSMVWATMYRPLNVLHHGGLDPLLETRDGLADDLRVGEPQDRQLPVCHFSLNAEDSIITT